MAYRKPLGPITRHYIATPPLTTPRKLPKWSYIEATLEIWVSDAGVSIPNLIYLRHPLGNVSRGTRAYVADTEAHPRGIAYCNLVNRTVHVRMVRKRWSTAMLHDVCCPEVHEEGDV